MTARGMDIRRVLQNFSYLMMGKIFSDSFLFIVIVVVSRVFGEEGIGEYSFHCSVVLLFKGFRENELRDLSAMLRPTRDSSRARDDLDG